MIVFADEDTYYRYVSRYYGNAGEYATSGGMYLARNCPHFVTVARGFTSSSPPSRMR